MPITRRRHTADLGEGLLSTGRVCEWRREACRRAKTTTLVRGKNNYGTLSISIRYPPPKPAHQPCRTCSRLLATCDMQPSLQLHTRISHAEATSLVSACVHCSSDSPRPRGMVESYQFETDIVPARASRQRTAKAIRSKP